MAALKFMDCFGKVPRNCQVSASQIAAVAEQELTAGLEGQRGRKRRQVQYISVKLVITWDQVVAGETFPAYVKLYAWLR